MLSTRPVKHDETWPTVLQGENRRDRRRPATHDVDPMPDLHRSVKGLRLARLTAHERDSIDVEVLAAYDRSVHPLAGMGAGIIDVALPARLANLAANRLSSLYRTACVEDRPCLPGRARLGTCAFRRWRPRQASQATTSASGRSSPSDSSECHVPVSS